ncbi:MAG: BACON domain-containing protein [Dysgonomonas sp.]
MKKIYVIYFILMSLLSAGFIACDNKDDNVLAVSSETLLFEAAGGDATFRVITNGEWSVAETPEWLSLNKYTGKGTEELTVMVKESDIRNVRFAAIVISSEGHSISVKVTQKEFSPKDGISHIGLEFSTFRNINKRDNDFVFDAISMFARPSFLESLYIGNLLNSTADSSTEIKEYTRYTYNPVDMGTSLPRFEKYTYTPSLEAYNNIISPIIEEGKFTQQASSHTVLGAEYYSYRQLYYTGMSEMGIELDKEVSGKSYKETEMTMKTGLIYSHIQTLFTVDMEYPTKLIQEDVKAEDFGNETPAYIASVNYGKAALLLVESNLSASELRAYMTSAINKKAKSSTKESSLPQIKAYYFHFDASRNLIKTEGALDAIEAYLEDVQPVLPLSFTVSNYFTNGVADVSFPLHLP